MVLRPTVDGRTMDVNEIKSKEYSNTHYTKLLETSKGKGIGVKRSGGLYVLGFTDGGKTIPEFGTSFLSPIKAYEYAKSVVKKLDEEGRGKKVKGKGKGNLPKSFVEE